MSIFKAYDVRGVYGRGIDEELTGRIAGAFVRVYGGGTYLVGHDARLHSRGMYDAFIRGLLEENAEVYGLGLCSTPELHFLQNRRGISAGVMITASHNPPEYHGIKFFDDRGGSVSYASGLERVEKELEAVPGVSGGAGGEAGGGVGGAPAGDGSYRDLENPADYRRFLAEAASGLRFAGRIVIDASNGSAGAAFALLVEDAGLDGVLINAEPDGTFPNHGPNPLEPASRVQLAETVRARGADLGVLLDGDGDRAVFVDETGAAVQSSFAAALLAEDILEREPGSAIVYDLISSHVLPERIRELGGRPVASRVGYTFLYDRMVEGGSPFGAETSGHAYFRVDREYYTESAAYALLAMLRLLERRGRPLSALLAPLRGRYAQWPETSLTVDDKDRAMRLVTERYAHGRIERTDGISVSFDDYWFNLRPSNTEPVLRLTLEARDESTAERRAREIVDLIEVAAGEGRSP